MGTDSNISQEAAERAEIKAPKWHVVSMRTEGAAPFGGPLHHLAVCTRLGGHDMEESKHILREIAPETLKALSECVRCAREGIGGSSVATGSAPWMHDGRPSASLHGVRCPQPNHVKCLWPGCESIGCPIEPNAEMRREPK